MTRAPDISGNFHAVRFYENDATLCSLVADFLGEGFARKQPGIVIATADHVSGILDQLEQRAFDVNRLRKEGRFIILDAEATLSSFMVKGTPDAAKFSAVVPPVISRANEVAGEGTVRAYGEMVDVLWRAGKTKAAIRLEVLWNELGGSHKFSLLCGYSMGNFYKKASKQEICSQHSHVLDRSVVPAL